MNKPEITDVENFWNDNPLFTGEVALNEDNPTEFFDAHDATYFHDVLVGINLKDIFYFPNPNDKTLDLGCGVGFWSSYFVRILLLQNLTSADLSFEALRLCKIRVPATNIQKENAERLSFKNETFRHINCQGVIHHTPDTQKCLDEIYRVLAPGGSASVSVYYNNYLLKITSFSLPAFKIAANIFLKNMGRGRDFSSINDIDDLVRYFDGNENPIGKAYGKSEFHQMLNQAGFKIVEFKYFFFPFRFFKVKFPRFIQGIVVHLFPFMIVANLKK